MPPAPVRRQPRCVVYIWPGHVNTVAAAGARVPVPVVAPPRVTLYSASNSLDVIFDSGAAQSLFDPHHAHALGALPDLGTPPLLLPQTTAAGRRLVAVRLAVLSVWWDPRRLGDPFAWPVLVYDRPTGAPPVLGLTAVPGFCRWTFDGTAPVPTLALDDTR